MPSNLKKTIIIFFLVLFGSLIFTKYLISFMKNEVLSIIKSDRFDTFIINIIDEKIERIAQGEIAEDKKNFYKDNFEKIIKKYNIIFE